MRQHLASCRGADGSRRPLRVCSPAMHALLLRGSKACGIMVPAGAQRIWNYLPASEQCLPFVIDCGAFHIASKIPKTRIDSCLPFQHDTLHQLSFFPSLSSQRKVLDEKSPFKLTIQTIPPFLQWACVALKCVNCVAG